MQFPCLIYLLELLVDIWLEKQLFRSLQQSLVFHTVYLFYSPLPFFFDRFEPVF